MERHLLEKQNFQQSTNLSLVDVKTGAAKGVGGSSPSMGRMALVAQLGEYIGGSPLLVVETRRSV